MAPSPNNSIHIDNVVVSSSQGYISAIPVRVLQRRGFNFAQVQRRTFGNRLVDNSMIFRLLSRELTIADALIAGNPN
jgi:hypothetical protein